jgi:putative PEP-CTERM system TPR-repeat lipoprotein
MRLPLLLLACWAGAAVAAPPPADAASKQELAYRFFDAAERCYAKRDLACALEQVRKALITDRDLMLAEVLLGKVLLEGGNAAGAEAAVERALSRGVSIGDLADTLGRARLLQGRHRQLLADARLDPARLNGQARRQVWLLRAQAQAELGQPQAAVAELDTLRADDPDNLAAALAELPLRLQLGQLREAQAAAARALRLAPDDADARLAQAQLLQAQGAQPEARLAALAQVLAVDARHLEARLMQAHIWLQQERWAELRDALPRLASDHGADPRVAYLQALEAGQRGERAAMVAALRRVTAQIDPQPDALLRFRPQMLLLGGMAHFALGEADLARSYLERYRDGQGSGNVGAQLLARLYLGQRQTAAGIAALEAALARNPGQAQTLELLGQARLAAGQPDQAVALMREALRSQASPGFYTTLGLALQRRGQLDAAIQAYQAALKADPQRTDAALGLAQALAEGGGTAAPQRAAAVLAEQLKRQPRQAAVRLQLARTLLDAGQPAAAQPVLEEGLKLDPSLHPARLILAESERRLGRADAAVARLTAMVKAEQLPVDASLALAALEENRDRPALAQDWLERALAKAGPQELRPQAALVEFLLRQRRPGEARNAAKTLLGLAPDHVGALMLSARTALALGDAAAARAPLVQAGRLADGDIITLAAVGRLQMAAGDAAGARLTLDKAQALQPSQPALQRLGVEAALMSGDVTEAETRARRLLEQSPRSALGYSLLGQAMLARRQTAAAIEAFAQAQRLAPGTENLLRLYAAQVGQVEPARNLALLEQWLAQRPDDSLVRNTLAESLVAQGRWADARRHYERLLKQTDANAVRNNLAEVLLQMKDPGALPLALEALKREPGNPSIIDTAGWAHALQGQHDKALQLLRDARLRQPSSGAIRYHLGSVLAAVGRRDEAQQELRAALADPQAVFDRGAAQGLLDKLAAGR